MLQNHLYLTDLHLRGSQSQGFYYLWYISKIRNQQGGIQTVRYKVSGKPRGITVMSKNVEYSPDEGMHFC